MPPKMTRKQLKAAEDAAFDRHIHDARYQRALARAHFEPHAKSCSITPYGMKIELTGLPPEAFERVLDAIDAFRSPEHSSLAQMERAAQKGAA